jgi:hypothetical protein
MQGIGGEQHAPSSVISVGTISPLLVGQDEGGVAGKRAEHRSRCPVVQVIEAAAQRLAIWCASPSPAVQRMTAEGGLEIVPLERQEQTAQRVHGWCSSEARPEGSVQALDGDEGDDLLVGGCPRQNPENSSRWLRL